MNDRQREFSHLVSRQMALRIELNTLEKKLDELEQIHLQIVKFGSLKNYEGEMLEFYERGGYQMTLDQYKDVYLQLFRIERRICELTNNRRDCY